MSSPQYRLAKLRLELTYAMQRASTLAQLREALVCLLADSDPEPTAVTLRDPGLEPEVDVDLSDLEPRTDRSADAGHPPMTGDLVAYWESIS